MKKYILIFFIIYIFILHFEANNLDEIKNNLLYKINNDCLRVSEQDERISLLEKLGKLNYPKEHNYTLVIIESCLSQNLSHSVKENLEIEILKELIQVNANKDVICLCIPKENLNSSVEFKIIKDNNEKITEEVLKGLLSKNVEDSSSSHIEPTNSEKTVSFLSVKNKLSNKNTFSDVDFNKKGFKPTNKKFTLELSQTRLRIANNTLISRRQEASSRGKRFTRMMWVSAIVLGLTFYCIIFMKTAIDCANNSKSASNKMKENKAKEITDKLQKEHLINNPIVESSD